MGPKLNRPQLFQSPPAQWLACTNFILGDSPPSAVAATFALLFQDTTVFPNCLKVGKDVN